MRIWGIPQTFEGFHKHLRDSTNIWGIPHKFEGFHTNLRDSTHFWGIPHKFEGFHTLLRDSTQIWGIPHTFEGFHKHLRDSTHIWGIPHTFEGFHKYLKDFKYFQQISHRFKGYTYIRSKGHKGHLAITFQVCRGEFERFGIFTNCCLNNFLFFCFFVEKNESLGLTHVYSHTQIRILRVIPWLPATHPATRAPFHCGDSGTLQHTAPHLQCSATHCNT